MWHLSARLNIHDYIIANTLLILRALNSTLNTAPHTSPLFDASQRWSNTCSDIKHVFSSNTGFLNKKHNRLQVFRASKQTPKRCCNRLRLFKNTIRAWIPEIANSRVRSCSEYNTRRAWKTWVSWTQNTDAACAPHPPWNERTAVVTGEEKKYQETMS